MLEIEKEYILDDDIIELINEVEDLIGAYFKNEVGKTTLIEKIRLKYEPYHSPLYISDLGD